MPKPRPRVGVISTTTSVRIEVELFIAARRRGVNLSQVLNAALRSLLKADAPDDVSAEDAVRQMVADRERSLEGTVARAGEEMRIAREQAMAELQVAFNLYLSQDPSRSLVAKLNWVGSRMQKYDVLRGQDPSGILQELAGV